MSDKRQEAIEKYVREFVTEYQSLAEQAEKQVEHTRTAGWQALCKGFKASISSAQAILAEELEQAAKLIKTRGPDDGVIKSIGDVKKRADEVYQTSQHFDTSVLLPIRQAAQRAGDLASRKRQESEQWDANTPLIWNGVRLAMARAINDLPRYVWNPGNWTVERLDAPGDVVPVLEQKVEVIPADWQDRDAPGMSGEKLVDVAARMYGARNHAKYCFCKGVLADYAKEVAPWMKQVKAAAKKSKTDNYVSAALDVMRECKTIGEQIWTLAAAVEIAEPSPAVDPKK
jgi:hypothetical protein